MTTDATTSSDRAALLSGAGFGLTSGVLTTLGLIVGLHSGTDSRTAVAAGIATVAISDALSDALGIHVSQESSGADARSAWIAAGMTFAGKFLFAMSFLLPVLLLPLGAAVLVSVGWGLTLLTGFSWWIARQNDDDPKAVVGEHLAIAVVVLVGSQLVGMLIDSLTD